MDAEILAFCDAATEAGNKINIIGVFDRVESDKEPIQISCAIAGRVHLEKSEAGNKNLDLSIVDPDGKLVFQATGEFMVTAKRDDDYANLQIVLALPVLRLLRFGEYELRLQIDGQLVKMIPLHVEQKQAGP